MAEAQEKDVKWVRWQKRRVFVRELAGKYGEVYRNLVDQPRVYHSKDVPFHGGPTKFGKNVINPQSVFITQLIETHIDVITPRSYGQKHAHMNSAVFYILEGKGHDIHDGQRIDWQEGDAAIVANACVHRHYNDGDAPARLLIIKAKPAFLFSHLLFQRVMEYPPEEAPPGYEKYLPED
ncbi:MAG: cupin domain-containing protein [Desulfobacterales bacterium]|nr:cupin domain-containing protein [Desulfobacterales bacterium]